MLSKLKKLLANLSLKVRISIFVALVLSAFTFIYIENVYLQYKRLDSLQEEIEGISHIKLLSELILLLQRHRGLTYILLSERESKDKLEAIENEVRLLERKIFKILGLYKKEEQHLRPLLERIERKLETLTLDKVYRLPPQKVFEMHTRLINGLMELVDNELVIHGVYFEGNYQEREIENAIFIKLLNLAEVMGQIRGLLSGAVAEGKLNEEEQVKILELYAKFIGLRDSLFFDLERVELPPQLKTEVEETKSLTRDFQHLVEGLIIRDYSFLDPQIIFFKASQAIDSLFTLQQDLATYLVEGFLRIRREELLFNLLKSSLLFFLLTTAVSVLTFLTYQITVDSLNKLMEGIRRVKKGEFNYLISVPTNDEIGLVAQVLNDALKEIREKMTLLKHYRYAIDASNVVLRLDESGRIFYVNKKFEEASGYLKKEVIGKSLFDVYKPQDDTLVEAIKRKERWEGLLFGKRKNGEECIAKAVLVPIFCSENVFCEFLLICNDITELEKSKRKLQYLLYYDHLTGLPNRTKLIEDLRRQNNPVLVFMDIQEFRYLNEVYGEECGDSILKRLAKELSNKKGIKVYRLYSDDFALLLNGEGKAPPDVLSFVEGLIFDLESKVFSCGGFEVFLSFNAGVVLSSTQVEPDKLVVLGDIALNKARRERKKVVLLDTREIDDEKQYVENIRTVKLIKTALREKKIIPYYQPIYNLSTGKIEKVEALARIVLNGELIPPGRFLPVAKKSKLYPELSMALFEKVLEDSLKLPVGVSFNISYEDVENEKVVRFIVDKLASFPNPQSISFEILESEEIEDSSLFEDFVLSVKKLGCKFAIDDFGTGYSNFVRLVELNIDFLKIDGSIVQRLLKDESAKALVEAVVSFCNKLQIKTVAEFVDSEELVAELKSLGVEYAQGYYFGKPMTLEELLSRLEESS